MAVLTVSVNEEGNSASSVILSDLCGLEGLVKTQTALFGGARYVG